jgi:hypothetical protein
MAWYVWPRSNRTPEPGTIIIADDRVMVGRWVVVLVFLLGATLAYLLITALRGRSMTWHERVAVIIGQIALVTMPATAFLILAPVLYQLECQPWSDLGGLKMPDGATYHAQFQYSSERVALTREVKRDRLFLRTRVLGISRGQHVAASLVRPAKAKEYSFPGAEKTEGPGIGRMVRSRSGEWLAFIYPYTQLKDPITLATIYRVLCVTDAVYDLRHGVFYGGADVKRVSPFILIRADDAVNGSDLDALLARGYGSVDQLEARRPAATLVRDLKNPNPRVRAAAARLLGMCVGEPKVAEAALTGAKGDPDPEVSRAAREGLHTLWGMMGIPGGGTSTPPP